MLYVIHLWSWSEEPCCSLTILSFEVLLREDLQLKARCVAKSNYQEKGVLRPDHIDFLTEQATDKGMGLIRN